MIRVLRIENFKSWRDTGQTRFAPLTAFFGPNSSGKTSILQFLLMLKQTLEARTDIRVLNLGGNQSYVDFGGYSEIVHANKIDSNISFEIEWRDIFEQPTPVKQLQASFCATEDSILLSRLYMERSDRYESEPFTDIPFNAPFSFEIHLKNVEHESKGNHLYEMEYRSASDTLHKTQQLAASSVRLNDISVQLQEIHPLPVFEDRQQGIDYMDALMEPNAQISELLRHFSYLANSVLYLGPVREYPTRIYVWRGDTIEFNGVGNKGEQTVQVLLQSQKRASVTGESLPKSVARWLQKLGLIHSFRVASIVEGRREYEVRVKVSANSPEVLITDVGFGVSQVLPVLTLCLSAPEGSILILEQPEIHLHPAIQSGLADVFVDVIKNRGVQIILESHSEHLLQRLQRRLAEEQLQPNDIALYFTHIVDGESKLEELQIDSFGNISNWPENFFGDEMGDLVAMAEAAMKRQMNNGNHQEVHLQ